MMRNTLAMLAMVLVGTVADSSTAWAQQTTGAVRGKSLMFGSPGPSSLAAQMGGQVNVVQPLSGITQPFQAGFVGIGPQQGFVGVSELGNSAGAGNRGQGNLGMQNLGGNLSARRQFGQGLGQNNMFGGGQQGNRARGANAASTIRTQLTVAFEAPASHSQQVSTSLSKRLANLPGIHWTNPGEVELQGRTAILRGVVATEHDRDLAERVVRLEAGVDQVQNQLVVASSASPAR